MKTIKIKVPANLTATAVDLFELWKGNVADSVAGLDEWLCEKTEVVVSDLAVLGLFRLAHAKELVNVVLVSFTLPDGSISEVTVAKDGRLSWWPKSVLDIEGDVTSELLSLRRQHVRTLATEEALC